MNFSPPLRALVHQIVPLCTIGYPFAARWEDRGMSAFAARWKCLIQLWVLPLDIASKLQLRSNNRRSLSWFVDECIACERSGISHAFINSLFLSLQARLPSCGLLPPSLTLVRIYGKKLYRSRAVQPVVGGKCFEASYPPTTFRNIEAEADEKHSTPLTEIKVRSQYHHIMYT